MNSEKILRDDKGNYIIEDNDPVISENCFLLKGNNNQIKGRNNTVIKGENNVITHDNVVVIGSNFTSTENDEIFIGNGKVNLHITEGDITINGTSLLDLILQRQLKY